LSVTQLFRDRRGVALPLTLIALVVVSFLGVAAAMLSGSELSIAGAYRSSTEQLYLAERGLEQHITAIANSGLAPAVGSTTLNMPGADLPVVVTVQELGRRTAGSTTTTYYSASAAPRFSNGQLGRTVSSLFTRQTTEAVTNLGITAGATFGGDVLIDGSITIAGKQVSTRCAFDSTRFSVTKLTTDKMTLKTDSAKALPNGRENLNLTREGLKQRVLGTRTMQDLYNSAQIKFPYNNIQAGNQITVGGYSANKPESKAPLATTTSTGQKVSPVRVTTYSPTSSHPYNWGCPYTTLGNTGCDWTRADTTFYPIVGIDAKAGNVTLAGDHGQGLLVVIGGNITIGSTFYYKGIIIADGELDINSTARVDGAVVAFGTVDVINDDDVHLVGGSTIITYDQCVVNQVNTILNNGNTSTTTAPVVTPSFAWLEVAR
jgi:Tfp pilus assembly protein PilX